MFRRRRSEDDFAEEIRAHLELEDDDLRQEGISPEKARFQARRTFGNVRAAQESFYLRGRWIRLDQEREFRKRDLPKGLSFQLQLDSTVVVLKPVDPNLTSDSAPPPPQIAIAASGDASPFRLTLMRDGSQATASVSSDTMGKLSLQTSDHPLQEKHS